MPDVKGKKFPYTKEGIKAAEEYASSDARGRSQKYQVGGEVLKYKEGGKVDITDVVKEASRSWKIYPTTRKHSKYAVGGLDWVADKQESRKEAIESKAKKALYGKKGKNKKGKKK